MNVDSVEHFNLGIGNIDCRMRDIKALTPSFDGYRFRLSLLKRVDVTCGSCDPNLGGRNQDFLYFVCRCGLPLEARFDKKFAFNFAS